MSQPPVPITKEADRLIRVSELGDWVYCNLAWKLKQLGVKPTAEAVANTEAGRAWHQKHGEVVVKGESARRARNLCIVLAVIAAAAGAVLWLLR